MLPTRAPQTSAACPIPPPKPEHRRKALSSMFTPHSLRKVSTIASPQLKPALKLLPAAIPIRSTNSLILMPPSFLPASAFSLIKLVGLFFIETFSAVGPCTHTALQTENILKAIRPEHNLGLIAAQINLTRGNYLSLLVAKLAAMLTNLIQGAYSLYS
ncbi:hypothetical protein EVA_15603 [gut metagenome]|uniref:Uncharacterized protein n=1 Tax=gut metagenome TaxID=749906 RepID=J9FMX8_9ZZZZ